MDDRAGVRRERVGDEAVDAGGIRHVHAGVDASPACGLDFLHDRGGVDHVGDGDDGALLRQRARPYLFSNALPPAVVAAGLAALDLVEQGDDLRAKLFENAAYWRAGLEAAGFDLLPGEHPIVPVMLYDARLAQAMAARLFELGVYVAGFFFPVVPKDRARIRTQMNAALSRADLDEALAAFAQAGRDTGVLK